MQDAARNCEPQSIPLAVFVFLLVMLTIVANCEIEGKLNSKSELSSLPPFSCSMIDVAMKIDGYQLTKVLDQLAQAR
jgi:hypothetical protein